MNINDIAITSLEVISGFDIATGAYLFTLDELQSASIANSEEKQDITGKQGRKLTSLKKNKSVVVSGTNMKPKNLLTVCRPSQAEILLPFRNYI